MKGSLVTALRVGLYGFACSSSLTRPPDGRRWQRWLFFRAGSVRLRQSEDPRKPANKSPHRGELQLERGNNASSRDFAGRCRPSQTQTNARGAPTHVTPRLTSSWLAGALKRVTETGPSVRTLGIVSIRRPQDLQRPQVQRSRGQRPSKIRRAACRGSIHRTRMGGALYDILGVDATASDREIRRAYLDLVLIHHPDKCGGDHELTTRITAAYAVLADSDRRRAYDAQLGSDAPPGMHQGWRRSPPLSLVVVRSDGRHGRCRP